MVDASAAVSSEARDFFRASRFPAFSSRSRASESTLHAWGMTETSPLGTVSIPKRRHRKLPEDERWDAKAKQGYPVAGVELRLMSETGEELPWDGVTMGELQVRGPWVAKEYFKLGASPEHFTKDGWFRTGDVSTIDEDGFMHITAISLFRRLYSGCALEFRRYRPALRTRWRGGGVSEAP